MISIKEGTFQILRPIFSHRIKGWLVGAVVGGKGGMAYTKRLPHTPNIFRDTAIECEKIRMQIFKDHPGIKEDKFAFGQAGRKALRS